MNKKNEALAKAVSDFVDGVLDGAVLFEST
jgi:hypothetical protein